MPQETQTGALYLPRGVGWGGKWRGGFKREETRVYVWLIPAGVWQKPKKKKKKHNAGKQLFFSYK